MSTLYSVTGELVLTLPGSSMQDLVRHAIQLKVDLSFSCFDEQDLAKVDFSGASLTYASFRNAILHGADFRCVDLRQADFRGANLRGARFEAALISEDTRWSGRFYPEQAHTVSPLPAKHVQRPAVAAPKRKRPRRSDRAIVLDMLRTEADELREQLTHEDAIDTLSKSERREQRQIRAQVDTLERVCAYLDDAETSTLKNTATPNDNTVKKPSVPDAVADLCIKTLGDSTGGAFDWYRLIASVDADVPYTEVTEFQRDAMKRTLFRRAYGGKAKMERQRHVPPKTIATNNLPVEDMPSKAPEPKIGPYPVKPTPPLLLLSREALTDAQAALRFYAHTVEGSLQGAEIASPLVERLKRLNDVAAALEAHINAIEVLS